MVLLHPALQVAAALGIVFASTTLVLIVWWSITKSWLRPLMMADKTIDVLIEAEMSQFFVLGVRSVFSLPSLFINTFFSLFGLLWSNLYIIVCLVLFASVGLIWMDTHHTILESYMVVRMCYAQEAINFFLLPTIDIVVMLYNAVIGLFDLIINLRAFAEYGAPIVLFKCALNEELGNLMFYVADLFFAFFYDLNLWISRGVVTGEWNVLTTLRTFGYIIDSLVPILNCFCRVLNPVWEGINLFANEPSVHFTINCILNLIVRLVQVLLVTIKYFIGYILPGFNPVKPDFTNATNSACCALYNAGDAIEDAVYIVVEMIWGILNLDLPPQLRQLLSVHYGAILSHPLCGVAKVINMTATLIVNLNDEPNGFLEPNGTGIRYLQFGFVADEVKIGAVKLGEPFYVFNVAAQAFVSQLALSVIDIAAFLLEWLIGNIWFFVWANEDDVLPHYPASVTGNTTTAPIWTTLLSTSFSWSVPSLSSVTRYLNFLIYYFPNYWIKAPPGSPPVTLNNYTYSSALSQLYNDTRLFAIAAGDLVGLFNNPVGCALEHFLKSIIELVAFLCNLVSFIIPIATFDTDPSTTARTLDTDTFFTELTYTSDCLGGIIKQFGNCTPTPNRQEENLFCCTGRLVTTGLDTIIILVQEIVHFFQDVLALPASAVELCLFGAYNPSREQCMRIPNLAGPIAELEAALCAFSCAVASIIPVTIIFNGFDCIFPPGEPVDDTSGGGGFDVGSLFDEFTGGLFNTGPAAGVTECSSVQSCIGHVICSILKIFVVPFVIVNQFFQQLIVGNPITNLFDFLNTSATLTAKAIGRAANAVGILIDCAFCAFFNDGQECSTVFYTLMHYVFVIPLVRLAGSFGFISFYLGRIVMSGVKQMFDGQGYLGLYSIVTKCAKLFGLYGEAANFWFTRVFTSMGLYMQGSTFSATSRGVCDYVEAAINQMAAAITAISFGTYTVPIVVMCCYGSFACWPFKRDVFDASMFTGYETNVTLTPDTWLSFFISHPNASRVFKWDEKDTCSVSMDHYKDLIWRDMTDDERQHAFFCIFKLTWHIRTDGQDATQLPNSVCDDAMTGLAGYDWASLRPLEKSTINNCITSRLYIDDMRRRANVPWFPQDWWTNEHRKMHFGMELITAARIYYQYMMDQSTAPSIMISPTYQAAWVSMGLNISHYNGLVTTDDVLLMRTHYHLVDYYAWNNNATQYEPIVWLTTGAWSFVANISARIAENAHAFSDNETNPTTYLPYTYHTDVPGGISDGILFDLVSRIFSSISEFARRWADPVNLKKRAAFFGDVRKMSGQVINRLSGEATRMSLEWWKAASHNISLYYGECEANETLAFMYEYELAIRGLDESHGNHSMLYRLGHWWQNAEIPTVQTIPVQKDGKYRGDNTTTTDNDGTETTMQRLARYVSIVRKGSTGANARTSQLMSGFYMMRNRIYTRVIKQRLDEIQEEAQTRATFSKGRSHDGATTYRIVKNRPLDVANQTRFYTAKLAELEHEAAAVTKPRFLYNRRFTTNALVRLNGLLDLTCTSSSAILCNECFFVDQLVGRIENGMRITTGYYQGGQYDAAFNQTMDLFQYSLNPNARARLGDSDELPARWPWSMFPFWRILGDPTPNKLRFNDVVNLTDGIVDNFGLSIQNSSLYTNINIATVDGLVASFIFRLFMPVIDFFYRIVIFLFSPTGVTDATASVSFLVENWLICDWNVGNAFTGANKRFSIGEALGLYVCIYLLILIVFTTVFGLNPWSLLASTGFAGMIVIFTFLNVTYNWAWLCWPGLPYGLFVDINYFLTHTVFTKCEWLFSGLILGTYNNDVCTTCGFALDVSMANCRDYGFQDIFSNVVFMLEYYTPWVIGWLRQTTTPLYVIYQIPFVNQRLNQFATLNMADPETFALYWACNAIITPLPFFINIALFAKIVQFLAPLLALIIALVGLIASLLLSVLSINYYVLRSFFFMTQLYPFFVTGNLETTISPGDSSNDDSIPSFDSPLPQYSFGASYNNSPSMMRPRNRVTTRRVPVYDRQKNTLTRLYSTLDHTRKHYFGGDHQHQD